MPIRPVSGLSLYFARLEHGFGGLFLEPLRRWSNRSRFCGKQEKAAPPPAEEDKPKRGRGRPKGSTKKKAAPPPAQEEMCSEPANEPVEGDEQSEAPDHQEEAPGARLATPRGQSRVRWTTRGVSLNNDALTRFRDLNVCFRGQSGRSGMTLWMSAYSQKRT